VQWPGCSGSLLIVPPRGMHWLGGSSMCCSTALTNRSNARCAWGSDKLELRECQRKELDVIAVLYLIQPVCGSFFVGIVPRRIRHTARIRAGAAEARRRVAGSPACDPVTDINSAPEATEIPQCRGCLVVLSFGRSQAGD
jgi:hypothetical protein